MRVVRAFRPDHWCSKHPRSNGCLRLDIGVRECDADGGGAVAVVVKGGGSVVAGVVERGQVDRQITAVVGGSDDFTSRNVIADVLHRLMHVDGEATRAQIGQCRLDRGFAGFDDDPEWPLW